MEWSDELSDRVEITRCENGFTLKLNQPYADYKTGRVQIEVFETKGFGGDWATPLEHLVNSLASHWGLFISRDEPRLRMCVEIWNEKKERWEKKRGG